MNVRSGLAIYRLPLSILSLVLSVSLFLSLSLSVFLSPMLSFDLETSKNRSIKANGASMFGRRLISPTSEACVDINVMNLCNSAILIFVIAFL
jgi:ABC-type transport system involved in cytochrome bd biosynthesis fused ATPase/permease subunit